MDVSESSLSFDSFLSSKIFPDRMATRSAKFTRAPVPSDQLERARDQRSSMVRDQRREPSKIIFSTRRSRRRSTFSSLAPLCRQSWRTERGSCCQPTCSTLPRRCCERCANATRSTSCPRSCESPSAPTMSTEESTSGASSTRTFR